jgi:hypothetical protein
MIAARGFALSRKRQVKKTTAMRRGGEKSSPGSSLSRHRTAPPWEFACAPRRGTCCFIGIARGNLCKSMPILLTGRMRESLTPRAAFSLINFAD